MKKCNKCTILKEETSFSYTNKAEGKRNSICKECFKMYAKPTSKLYNTWRGMKDRCLNPNHKNYNLYKDRFYIGWSDFKDFKVWALSNGYQEGLTIDRIDSAKGYSPDNCQFLTASDNTRKGNIERSGKCWKDYGSKELKSK